MSDDVRESSASGTAQDFERDLPPNRGLPEGLTKEIIKTGDETDPAKPERPDEVTVHYVGTLEDGTVFDSSRARGQPATFTIGKGHVVKGAELAVATMAKGEISKFALGPEFAYGDAGNPPLIPQKATLIFEIELISWVKCTDLFDDDGAIKKIVKEGSGWLCPKYLDEVQISLKAYGQDGRLVEERVEMSYLIGCPNLGALSRSCDQCLKTMKRGEICNIKCNKDHFYGKGTAHESGTIELTLHEIHVLEDVSLAHDDSLVKKLLREGHGHERPRDLAKCRLKVEAGTDGEADLAGFVPATLEFTAGNGEVCDALEVAVLKMKEGERAMLTCRNPRQCIEDRIGITKDHAAVSEEAPEEGKIVLTVELESFQQHKDAFQLSEEEKLKLGQERKEVGSGLFKRGRLELALMRYRGVIELLTMVGGFSADGKQTAEQIRRVCYLNKAACHLKLEQYREAKKSCDEVLAHEADSVKALFRRAQASLALDEIDACIRDVKLVIKAEPQNQEARSMLSKARALEKERDSGSKPVFASMLKGLTSPPPGAAQPQPNASPEAECFQRIKDLANPGASKLAGSTAEMADTFGKIKDLANPGASKLAGSTAETADTFGLIKDLANPGASKLAGSAAETADIFGKINDLANPGAPKLAGSTAESADTFGKIKAALGGQQGTPPPAPSVPSADSADTQQRVQAAIDGAHGADSTETLHRIQAAISNSQKAADPGQQQVQAALESLQGATAPPNLDAARETHERIQAAINRQQQPNQAEPAGPLTPLAESYDRIKQLIAQAEQPKAQA